MVVTSEELRLAALARSARRNREVSRRRVRRRWVTYLLYKLTIWTLPLVLVAELAWALWWREHPLPPWLQAFVTRAGSVMVPQAQSPSAPGPTPRGDSSSERH